MHTNAAHGAAEATAENTSIGINRLYEDVALSTALEGALAIEVT